jgi:hypothetical protein
MAQYETIRGVGVGARAAIDEGLRAHMNKVYGLMSVAMLVTGGVAWAVGTSKRCCHLPRPRDAQPEYPRLGRDVRAAAWSSRSAR